MELVFGIHAVLECLRSGSRPVEKIHIARGASGRGIEEVLRLARKAGVSLRFEHRAWLDQRAGGAHQGVVAVCGVCPTVDLEQLLKGLPAQPLLVLLDSIEDPRNLGAILRNCAAAGADGVVLPKDRSVGLTPTVSKTAAGALEYVPVVRVTNLVTAIQRIRDQGLWVVGVETGKDLAWYDVDYTVPVALVFGNENKGLRRLVQLSCDRLVSIPTPGPIQSLNVSVASGIALFEVCRQRSG
ncbi:MAG: 23S rRNA (guanosine(2251)-2'-O)-methyltransferase RlmB [Acidobacteriota bacterium]